MDPNSMKLTNSHVLDAFEDLRLDAVIMANYSAVPGYGSHSFLQVKSPEQLRSPFAAFDPARKDSKNILASHSLGLTGTGAYGLMGSDSDANAMSYIGPKGMSDLFGPGRSRHCFPRQSSLRPMTPVNLR